MVTARSTLTVIPYERRYRAQTLDLLDYSFQRHLHLDWHDPDQWLDSSEAVIRLAFRGAHMVGMMAAARPIAGMAWVRMVAVADGVREDEVLSALWEPLAAALREIGTESVWILMIEPWFEYYMPLFNMSETERLVTLRRDDAALPVVPDAAVQIEPAVLDDLSAMVAVDNAAFPPPFLMTIYEMRRAYRFAALSRVARDADGRVVGYQISTRHADQGHLARLAVEPSKQGAGIGGALIQDMCAAFVQREVLTVTVNTQITNTRSQRLYAATGFVRSSHDIPIYSVGL